MGIFTEKQLSSLCSSVSHWQLYPIFISLFTWGRQAFLIMNIFIYINQGIDGKFFPSVISAFPYTARALWSELHSTWGRGSVQYILLSSLALALALAQGNSYNLALSFSFYLSFSIHHLSHYPCSLYLLPFLYLTTYISNNSVSLRYFRWFIS